MFLVGFGQAWLVEEQVRLQQWAVWPESTCTHGDMRHAFRAIPSPDPQQSMHTHSLFILTECTHVGRLGHLAVRQEGLAHTPGGIFGAVVPRFAALFRVPGTVEDMHLTKLSPE
jgi:hypothetical protein